jgi:uncharacterized protein (TIGR02246 family)
MPEQKEGTPMRQNNIEQKTVSDNFNRWNEALLSRDPKAVAELYTEDATFLPTLSPEFKSGKKETEEYFAHFLQKNPIGTVLEEKIQTLSPKSYLHSGMYNFEVGPADDRQIVEARFTYLWTQTEEGKWKIAHHHSSVKPKAH